MELQGVCCGSYRVGVMLQEWLALQVCTCWEGVHALTGGPQSSHVVQSLEQHGEERLRPGQGRGGLYAQGSTWPGSQTWASSHPARTTHAWLLLALQRQGEGETVLFLRHVRMLIISACAFVRPRKCIQCRGTAHVYKHVYTHTHRCWSTSLLTLLGGERPQDSRLAQPS